MRIFLLTVAIVMVSDMLAQGGSEPETTPAVGEAKPIAIPFSAEEAQAGQAAWARKINRQVVEKNSVGMELVLIPPGSFKMGSPPDEEDHEDDERQVDVALTKPFYLGKTEITQGQWEAVMRTRPWQGMETIKEGADYPATYINWNDAREFCKKLSEKEGVTYRLPTEAEWEWACRAGTTTPYAFGNNSAHLKDHAWFHSNAANLSEKYAHLVGQKHPNAFGLYDMLGNLWEWCEDTYREALPGGTDPLHVGPASYFRVNRGGCWFDSAEFCRSAARYRSAPDSRSSSEGFRVVQVASGK